MRILTLIENTAATEKLFIEHGLSFYIEHNGYKILFDTGASDKWKKNAERMRVDVASLDYGVVSHNHYDHTGGIDSLLNSNANIKIFMRKNACAEYYKKIGILKVAIGQNPSFFEKRGANFVFFNSFQQVCPGVFLMSDEQGEERFVCNDRSLLKRVDGKYLKDDFSHELFMVIFPGKEQKDGCVIVSSCSHRGIINIIKTVQKTWPEFPILAVVGGFHLMGKSTKKLNCSMGYITELCDELVERRIGMVYTCHCTGQKGYELLKANLGDQIQYLQTGEELDF